MAERPSIPILENLAPTSALGPSGNELGFLTKVVS